MGSSGGPQRSPDCQAYRANRQGQLGERRANSPVFNTRRRVSGPASTAPSGLQKQVVDNLKIQSRGSRLGRSRRRPEQETFARGTAPALAHRVLPGLSDPAVRPRDTGTVRQPRGGLGQALRRACAGLVTAAEVIIESAESVPTLPVT